MRQAWRDFWGGDGGGKELLRLAVPLMVSHSVLTLQIIIDRAMLGRLSSQAVGAAGMAVAFFWTPLILLQMTAAYATTFVAQYVGARQNERVGPAVWQAIYFSLIAGLGFLIFVPLAELIIALGEHPPELQPLEMSYFQCLCFSALPTLVLAATSSFFAGQGKTWTVCGINAVGLIVNGILDYAWIFGHWGFPAWGIAGAGWATVVGQTVSALLALTLFLRPKYRSEFATLRGWRLDGALFRRLMRFGLPSGLQIALDILAFTVFLILIGRLGPAELTASTIAFTLNMIVFMPGWGIAQGVSILVGQRVGEGRPAVAERSTYVGFALVGAFMTAVASGYILAPEPLLALFHSSDQADQWADVAALAPTLLIFVAVYTLFDGMNIVFSCGLKGAGDTRYVMLVSLALSWPLMVLPTWAAWRYNWGLYWAWAFVSCYIAVQALFYLQRFRAGHWKSMRVIEKLPLADAADDSADAGEVIVVRSEAAPRFGTVAIESSERTQEDCR
jgi:MATE family multidrug resistance protein